MAFKVDRVNHTLAPFNVRVPVVLHIDPRGHFTGLRCAAIIWLDRLALRSKLLIPRVANLCEFLANYPNF